MDFIFEKRGTGNWWHYQGTIREMATSEITIIFEAVSQTVSLQFPNGSNFPKDTIAIADAKVRNGVSGVLESFTTVAQLRDRLVALGYPPLIEGGAITVPNLSDVLLVGGRENVIRNELTYEFIGANKAQLLFFEGDGTSDVSLTLNTDEFNDGDSIVGYNATLTFNLIINNDGFILPETTPSFTVPPYYTFVITRIVANTYTISLIPYDASVGGATNLGYTASPTNGVVTSSTGTDATIPLANGTNAGLSENNFTDSEKTVLGNTSGTNSGDQDLSGLQVKSNWVDYSATSTINGWSAFTTKEIFIKEEDKGAWVKIKIEGTSTTGTTSCTISFNADETKRAFTISRNAGTYGSGVVDTASGSNVLTFYNTVAGGSYTTSGVKLVDVTLFIKKT